MLLGTDEFETTEEQSEMDPLVFIQWSQAVLCALKMVMEAKVWGPGSFVNIWQGTTKAYLDFIDRLQEVIQKHIENQEAAYTLVLQLDYENANNDCKAVLNLLKLITTDISQFIKAFQNVGMEQHQTTLLAAAIRGKIKCFNCGRLGHTHWECQNRQKNSLKNLLSKDCPWCGKGKHWASECRSQYKKKWQAALTSVKWAEGHTLWCPEPQQELSPQQQSTALGSGTC